MYKKKSLGLRVGGFFPVGLSYHGSRCWRCGLAMTQSDENVIASVSEANRRFDVKSIQTDPNIYSPRVSNEMLVPYRKTLTEFFPEAERQKYHDNPALLVDWVKQNIQTSDNLNPQRYPISPLGVLKARKADRHSRNIFFVSMARSLGIAAQINPVNGNVQYFDNQWNNVDFEAAEPASTAIGYLDIQYRPIASVADPKYYTHFSIKKFDGKSFRLLAYDAKDPGIDDGTIRDDLVESLHLSNDSRPIFIIANTNSEVVFMKQGYTIGLGEQMLKVMAKL